VLTGGRKPTATYLIPAKTGIPARSFPLRVSVFAAIAAAATLFVMPTMAQTPTDLTQFNASCQGGELFLIGEMPEGTDSSSILTPLCGCLGTAFKDMPQKDVDMLAADLRGEGTDEAHTAHGDYVGLTERARVGLNSCFASPDVAAALQAAQPPTAADPAAPATP
jgi:hypothetical protein